MMSKMRNEDRLAKANVVAKFGVRIAARDAGEPLCALPLGRRGSVGAAARFSERHLPLHSP